MTGDSVCTRGQEVKRLRRSRGWTQEELARRIQERAGSFAKRTLGRIEAGRPVHLRSVRLVAEELGVDLTDLLEHRGAAPNNLPSRLTSFIGRDRERNEIRGLLSRTRLLTLTGMGGSGKSRLGIEVARDLIPDYADGVWLVELAPLADPALVPQAVAEALSVREQPKRSLMEILARHLEPKKSLLVLDNCEHLLGACAELASTLLPACTELRILATSREGMDITGETIYSVPPLRLPDAKRHYQLDRLRNVDSVRLFVERAAAVRTEFSLSESNAPAVVEICHRLDGIPLALELAAARVRAISVTEIAERLGDRFHLLTDGHRAEMPRHRTLRALIDWSYDQLSDSERALLRCLSVFAGGWTLQAAERVCAGENIEEGQVLDLLSHLVGKSLVVMDAEEEQGTGRSRYRLLETVRQYAHEHLFEEEEHGAARERHRDFFLALAEEAETELDGPDQSAWLSRLDAEHDNLRTALKECQSGDVAEGNARVRLVGALRRFWEIRGFWNEGLAVCSEVLSATRASARSAVRAKALRTAGLLSLLLCDFTKARSLYEESLAISRELGDGGGVAASLNELGFLAWNQGDYAEARDLHTGSLAIARELGNKRGICNSLLNLGEIARMQGDNIAASSLFEESLAIWRELGVKGGIAAALANLGIIASMQRDYPKARSLYAESLSIYRELGHKDGIATMLNNMGNLAWRQGDCTAAGSLFKESLVIMRELGHRRGVGMVLQNLGNVACERGNYAEARVLYEEGLAISRELGEKGRMVNRLTNLGKVTILQGDHAAAHLFLTQSLAMAQELGSKHDIARSIRYLGFLASKQKRLGRAAQLLAVADTLAQSLDWVLAPDDRREFDTHVAAARAELGDDGFTREWSAGEAMELDQAIEYALRK